MQTDKTQQQKQSAASQSSPAESSSQPPRKKESWGGLDIFRYIGPGLLVTVGFIDPGNWASNFAAGSSFGYSLLWVVTLSTIMLIALQHNVAHLGIVTGLCLSESAEKYAPKWIGRPIIMSAILASISTSLAEILGSAIALQMLFDIPIIGDRSRGHYAVYKLLSACRTCDYHFRFDHWLVVYL